MAAAVVDVGYVAGHLGLAEDAVLTVTTEPTPELVAQILQAVIAKAQEFDELYAAKLQVDIELESAHHSAETRCQSFKATADNALKELEEVRQKLKEEETARQTIENELQALKSRGSDHDSEISILRDRVESLQASNRANMALLESRNTRDTELSEELAKQHQKNVQLNKEITTLQQSIQAVQATASSAKYREESLQQQLELARRNGDWFENELKTKSDEALKYRKEKGARIAELQRQNDEAKSDVEALKRTEKQLRDRLEVAQAKADEALTKVQQQQEFFARSEESYKLELESRQRLVEMKDQSVEREKERVKTMEGERVTYRTNHANEMRAVQLELEREKQNCQDLDERVQQLEGEIDELHARMEHGAAQPGSAPQTPRPLNGSLLGRAGSPFATPGSIRSKSAITTTQAIDELYKVKGILAGEKRRNQQLSEELDNMMSILEAKTPEINELQAEADSLRSEISKMSQMSQQSFEERDAAKKMARKAESALSTSQAEVKILRTQLRDLSTQIQMLVFNMHAREKGLDELTREETIRLEQLSRGEVTENALADMSDTHQFITQKFVVFKDVQELQSKNQELLRVTRELAEQMESEEAVSAKHQALDDHNAVERLRQELTNMIDEARSLKTTMESYKAERDMFRRLLQQKASAGELASILGSSVDDTQRLPLASIETDQDNGVTSPAYRTLQTEYDDYRNDQEGVRQSMRDQIDQISTERNNLHGEVAKITSQLTLASERFEMLHSNYVALQTENKELQRRSQTLSETAAKQDIRTQQVAEELIEARGLLESMRNEAANLKAEKKLWKEIQDRLSKDNEGLMQEKARLNSLVATQQSMQNERDISESESRRKFSAKIESLESELATTKRKLSDEIDEGKKLQLRKEFDGRESQKRIDELSSSLSQIREEHVSVKTSRDHLQARVDELTVELRNAEERFGRLQPRPTPRPGSMAAPPSQAQEEAEAEVRDLVNEVSDVKRDLEMARTHLENAKDQAEQYRQLSQQNEEALAELTSSQEQYREEMDAIINSEDSKIKELEQRVEDLSTELASSNSELSTLRDSQGEVARRFEEEKNILDEEIKRLKDEAERYSEASKFHQQDLRAQAEITTKAQQDYEHELVKHAEAAKLVQSLRIEYNQLKSQSAALKADAESAKVALMQSEGSWEERRVQLEQEISELKTRYNDVNAQNKLLHQQLEGITSQFSALKQGRNTVTEESNGTDTAAEGLRELNNYLRREKEILEVQYDLKVQESKRLQQQLEYSHSQLDEARLKLDQERRSQSESGQASLAHKDLMDKLNELNLYREASATLRNELAQAKSQLTQKSAKIEELEGKVQPLEAKIEELQTQKGFLEEELKQIQEDRDRWQKRTEGILTKYGRVDPADMDLLKQKIEALEKERETLLQAEAPLKSKVDEVQQAWETERANWLATRQKLEVQFKERSRKITGDRNDALAQKNQLQEQLDTTKTELENTRQELQVSKQQGSSLEQQIQSFQQQVEKLRQDAQVNQASTQPTTETSASASVEVVAHLEQQLAEVRQQLDAISAQKAAAERDLDSLRSQLQTAVSERNQALQKTQQAARPESAEPGEVTMQNGSGTISDEERRVLEAKIAAAEAKAAESDRKAQEVEATINQTIKERSDKMRNALNEKLKESRSKIESDVRTKMEDDFKTRMDQERVIWQAEMQAAPPIQPNNQQAQGPATPVKHQESEQQPGTPTSTTPSGAAPADWSQLPDSEVRKLLATNPTVRNIMTSNLKKKMETEIAKAKAELEQTHKAESEQRVAVAREEGQMLAQQKSKLMLNMAENKFRMANAKIEVVATAATETPERPVGEVWEVAKNAKPPPQQQAIARPAPSVQPGTNSSAAAPPPSPAVPTAAAATPKAGPGVSSSVPNDSQGTVQPGASGIRQPNRPAATANAAGAQPAAPPAVNPFAVSATSTSSAPNPFAAAAGANTTNTPFAPGGAANTLPNPFVQGTTNAQAQQPQRTSSIPIPGARGGAAGRGRGAYTAPQGNRVSSGGPNERGGFGSNSDRGRGGGQGGRGRGGGAPGGLNASANDFQPGNKRPRGDSEVVGGAKRARGNH